MTKPYPNRKIKRATEANTRRAPNRVANIEALANLVGVLQKNVGMLQKSVAELGQLHSQQVHQVELLRQAFNTNHAAYVSAISQADGHMSVMRVVITDMNRHAD